MTFKDTRPLRFTPKSQSLTSHRKSQKPITLNLFFFPKKKSFGGSSPFLQHFLFPFHRSLVPPPAPASVRFLSSVELTKSQHCNMWECRYEKEIAVVTFFCCFLFSENENAGCSCWVVAVVVIIYVFLFLNPLLLYKVQLQRWAPCEMAVVMREISSSWVSHRPCFKPGARGQERGILEHTLKQLNTTTSEEFQHTWLQNDDK